MCLVYGALCAKYAPLACKKGFTMIGRFCVILSGETNSYTKAQSTCSKMNPNVKLLDILLLNDCELLTLADFVQKKSPNSPYIWVSGLYKN